MGQGRIVVVRTAAEQREQAAPNELHRGPGSHCGLALRSRYEGCSYHRIITMPT